MPAKACYSPEYFSSIRSLSRASAEVVAPLVMKLLRPCRVVDVGCGTGAWAAAFKAAGADDVLAIDGDYCDRASLEIAEREFLAADLTKPLILPDRYDLAICLEVAEHLNSECACQLIESLTKLAPAVLFSAAVPFQGGEHHVNEQWPSYWISLFAERDYVALDLFRQQLWTNEEVAWWYVQNMMLFVHSEAVDQFRQFQRLVPEMPSSVPSLIHPRCWLQLAWRTRVLEAAIELMNVTPTGARILMVDHAELGELPFIGRTIEPFTERGGIYNGPPIDSHAAIQELERKLAAGETIIAFAWPAFWWLDHYKEFAEYLRTKLVTVLMNERWIIFQSQEAGRVNSH